MTYNRTAHRNHHGERLGCSNDQSIQRGCTTTNFINTRGTTENQNPCCATIYNTINDTMGVQAKNANIEKLNFDKVKKKDTRRNANQRDKRNLSNSTFFNNKLDISYGKNDNVSDEVPEATKKDSRKLTFDKNLELLEQDNNIRSVTNMYNVQQNHHHHHQQKCNIHRGHQTLQNKFDVFCLTCYRERVSMVNARCSIMEQQQCAIASGNDSLRTSEWI